LVLATRGISPRRGFFSAFSEGDVVYDSTYYGFASLPQHTAHYLNGVLNSLLASYFLFLTGSTWGIERREVQPIDLLRLPIPAEDGARLPAIKGVIEAAEVCECQAGPCASPRYRARLDEAVYELYGLDEAERILVKDMVDLTVAHQLRPVRSHAQQRPTRAELCDYARELIGAIDPILATRGQRSMVAEVLDPPTSPLIIVRFAMVARRRASQVVRVTTVPTLDGVLARLDRRLHGGVTDGFHSQRILRVYAGDDLYVVKRAARRYWSRSAALNDSDLILAEHLGAGRDQ